MAELQVIVNQEPGVVSWNFEQLKTQLAQIMESYASLVYTEESITSARADVAGLRKLKTAVEDRRKEIRRKCLEPYETIEAQAKELTALIDRPIDTISGQIKNYEEKQRREKKAVIMAFMKETFSDLPQDIAAKLTLKAYDSKWENSSTPKKTYVEAIKAAHEQVLSELRILAGVDEDFRETVMQIYGRGLVLADALEKANELHNQREMLKEKERQRREAEERRKAEELARQQAEAAAKAQQAEAPAEAASNEGTEPENPHSPLGRVVESIDRQNFQRAAASEPVKATMQDGTVEMVLRIRGSEKQLAKILGFITYAGATYQEVEA